MPASNHTISCMFAAFLALSSCDTPKERAQEHLSRGMSLLSAGEMHAARNEFRNSFRLDPGLLDARRQYAEISASQGSFTEAISQYLTILQEKPDSVSDLNALADLALRAGDLELAGIQVERALAIEPDNGETRSLAAAIDYTDPTRREAAVVTAKAVLKEFPDNLRAHELLIVDRLAKGDSGAALELLDKATQEAGPQLSLEFLKLQALDRDGAAEAVATQLKRMARKFPNNRRVMISFGDWFAGSNRTDEALAFLDTLPATDTAPILAARIALLRKAGRDEEAERHLAGLREEFPELKWVPASGVSGAAQGTLNDLPNSADAIRQAIAARLELVARDPGNVTAHTELAELALRVNDLALAKRHVDLANELADDDTDIQAIKAAVDVREPATRDTAILMAKDVLATAPDNPRAHQAVIAAHMLNGDPSAALTAVETALEHANGDETLNVMKLSILEKMQDDVAVGQQLVAMVGMFPENMAMRQALVGWNARRGNVSEGEAVLRAGIKPTSQVEDRLAVVKYLLEMRGEDAARTELEDLINTQVSATPYQVALADLEYSLGNTDTAVSYLRRVQSRTDDARVSTRYAQLLAAQRSMKEAARVVNEVLDEHPDFSGALKLRAQLHIHADDPDTALVDLRNAATNTPNDPEIFSIMAMAHQRAGAAELRGDALGMAARASNYSVAETLRYANYLMNQGDTGAAEVAVQTSLARHAGSTELLTFLGRIHLARSDWGRAEQVADRLSEGGNPTAERSASLLRAEVFQAQGREAERLEVLTRLVTKTGDPAALPELVKAHVNNGEIATAMRYVDDVLAKQPDDEAARLLKAGILVSDGKPSAAEAEYRALIERHPTQSQAYELLHVLLEEQGKTAEAAIVLDRGIENASDKTGLLISKAGQLELSGDIPGALEIFESLYRRDSSNPWVANNLASLLTFEEQDEGTLDRAYAIARRFRDTDNPYFQDTYGWILHLRGDPDEALRYLRAASEQLPDNAQISFHLAEARLAAGDPDAARHAYETALIQARKGAPLPQISLVEQRLSQPGLSAMTGTN